MKTLARRLSLLALTACAFAVAGSAAAQGRLLAGTTCNAPPRVNCPEANCLPELMQNLGNAVEPKTGRKFFLDYPCDLKPGEKVTVVLNLHGGGSIGNWQRHYFPIVDFKDKYRLVVATPTAATAQPTRRWTGEADDVYLQNITDLVFGELGRANVKSFWLAGHSQGGATSRRIVCSPYFRNKVDGFLSLSGGRVGSPAVAPPPRLELPPAAGRGTAPAPTAAQAAAPLDCDFSHIFAIGELEASGQNLPATSSWAQKYACGARTPRPDIVDTRAGYVTATDQSRGPSWGTFARPGTSKLYVYPGCKDGRVVADVVRINKGHTEGLEPNVLEEIVKLMTTARGGKVQGRG